MAHARRVLISDLPFGDYRRSHGVWLRDHWPAKWIAPVDGSLPAVFACRLSFATDAPSKFRLHLSADERYILYLNGEEIGRGPERGDLNNWFFETHDVELPAGAQVLTAMVWALGGSAPVAQLSAGPAFLLAAEGPHESLLNTGVAAWECLRIEGISTVDHPFIQHDGFAGKKFQIDGRAFPWGFERGGGEGWQAARVVSVATSGYPCERQSNRSLRPALLPAMIAELVPQGACRFAETDPPGDLNMRPCDVVRHDADLGSAIDRLLHTASPLALAPRSRIRAVIDLDNYYCAYPLLTCSGGRNAFVRIRWAESLYLHPPGGPRDKGNRNEIAGKYFRGYSDTFICDGGANRSFPSLWWQAGRFVQIEVETADEALSIALLRFCETRYPLSIDGRCEVSPPDGWPASLPLCRRAIEVSTHETLVDSPYYEQLAYIGDARIAALCHYAVSADDRPARKAIELFDVSRVPEGFTQSRYPSRVMQVIPPFSLHWIEMVHEYALWRGDEQFVRHRLSGCRAVLEAFVNYLGAENLLRPLPGWAFVDWSKRFESGEVSAGDGGVNAVVHWQLVAALRSTARLERRFGIAPLADHYEATASRIGAALCTRFWSPTRGAFADDLSGAHFSEHAQAAAILSGMLDAPRLQSCVEALRDPPEDFARATVYFTHYIIDALRAGGAGDAIWQRLSPWADLVAMGLRCTPESPEPPRSDAHGWSAHPIYHTIATIAGIRPADFGFNIVEFRPMPGALQSISVEVPHPRGMIRADVRRENGAVVVEHYLPEGCVAKLIGARAAC